MTRELENLHGNRNTSGRVNEILSASDALNLDVEQLYAAEPTVVSKDTMWKQLYTMWYTNIQKQKKIFLYVPVKIQIAHLDNK